MTKQFTKNERSGEKFVNLPFHSPISMASSKTKRKLDEFGIKYPKCEEKGCPYYGDHDCTAAAIREGNFVSSDSSNSNENKTFPPISYYHDCLKYEKAAKPAPYLSEKQMGKLRIICNIAPKRKWKLPNVSGKKLYDYFQGRITDFDRTEMDILELDITAFNIKKTKKKHKLST